MRFDKFFDSKFFTVLEYLYRLILLNLLTIIFTVLTLVVFGLFPAFIALVICIKSMYKDTEFPLIKSYFYCFIKNYKKGMILSIFFILLGAFLTVDTYYFYCAVSDWGGFFYEMGYYVLLALDCVFILALINSFFVYVYFPELKYFKMIKYSFKLLAIEAWKCLVIIVILIGFIYLFALFPYIIIFVAFSAIIAIANAFFKNDYLKIGENQMKSLNVFNYIKEKVDDKN